MTFWAFCAVMVVIVLYIAITKTQWLKLIFRTSANKLTKSQFFRILRLMLLIVFALLISLIVLTFIAPLTLTLLEKLAPLEDISIDIENVSESVRKAERRILGDIDIDRKLSRALEKFEQKDYESGADLLTEIFMNTKRRPPKSIQGYVIATYYGADNYKRAAREVLEKDKMLSVHDYSVWGDLALSLRQYSRKHSLPAAIDFTETLQSEYGEKLISYVWSVLPVDVTMALIHGMHNTRNLPFNGSRFGWEKGIDADISDTNYVLNKYPKDSFIEFAYYYLGQYAEALKANDNIIIRDIILYAAGYEIIQYLRDAYLTEGFYTGGIKNIRGDQKLTNLAHEAIGYFQVIVDMFPKSKHADDAAVWMGWLKWQLGDMESAIKWFTITPTVGNGDYIPVAERFNKQLFRSLDKGERERVVTSNPQWRKNPFYWYVIAREYYREHDYNRSLQIAKKALHELPQSIEPNYEALEYLISSGKKILSLQKGGQESDYKKVANELRVEHKDYRASIFICDEAIKRFPYSKLIDNFLYMKILALVRWKPAEVEKVVNEFCQKYPDSEFTDDVLAEMTFLQVEVQGNIDAARKTVRRILRKYAKRNAVDNALNWLSIGLWRKNRINGAEEIDKKIIAQFSGTRFSYYAKRRLDNHHNKP